MENRSQTQGLRFILCPTKCPDPSYKHIYNEIYQAWHALWSQTYKELNDPSPLYSDAFTRQDFAAAIFKEDKCLAFILFRNLDLSLDSSFHDSYFEQWNEIHLKKVHQAGNHILICGNLGIAPLARQISLGFSMKDLLCGFIAEVALHSTSQIVISTPRKDKGVHTAAYRWGGVPIAQDIDWGLNVVVDLVALYKEELRKKRNHEILPLVLSLWDQMLVVPERPLETMSQYQPFKKQKFSKFKKAA